MGSADLAILALVVSLSAYLAWQNVGRALLFLRPGSLVVEPEVPADQGPPPETVRGLARELEELGFVFLGSHSERAWRRKTQLFYDFAHPTDRTFATVWVGPHDERKMEILTWAEVGGILLTANHRRPVREEPGRYQSSYLVGTNVARLYKAHTRRLEGRVGQGPFTLDGRVNWARAWIAGPGRSEIRLQHVSGLLWTLGTVGMVAAAVFGRRHS